MLRLKRILLPTDFSDCAALAKKYACAFTEQFEAELHVLHVFEEPVPTIPVRGVPFPPSDSYLIKLEEQVAEELANVPDRAWQKGKQVAHATAQGHAFLEIIRYAKENEIDLIVIGTHGRTGLKHVLMGSVAEQVVRMAPCPVLTVHPNEHEFVLP